MWGVAGRTLQNRVLGNTPFFLMMAQKVSHFYSLKSFVLRFLRSNLLLFLNFLLPRVKPSHFLPSPNFFAATRDFDNCFSFPLILPPFGCLPSRSLKFFSGFTNAGLLTLVHLIAFLLAPLFWGGCGGKVEIWTEEEEKERKKIAAAWVFWFGLVEKREWPCSWVGMKPFSSYILTKCRDGKKPNSSIGRLCTVHSNGLPSIILDGPGPVYSTSYRVYGSGLFPR